MPARYGPLAGVANARSEVARAPLPLLPRAALALANGLHNWRRNAVLKYGRLTQGATSKVTILLGNPAAQ